MVVDYLKEQRASPDLVKASQLEIQARELQKLANDLPVGLARQSVLLDVARLRREADKHQPLSSDH